MIIYMKSCVVVGYENLTLNFYFSRGDIESLIEFEHVDNCAHLNECEDFFFADRLDSQQNSFFTARFLFTRRKRNNVFTLAFVQNL